MVRVFICAILVFATITTLKAQDSQTKYYKTEALDKEVGRENAKFSETFIHHEDGSTTREVREVKKNKLIRSETFKGDEPYGVWHYNTSSEEVVYDYNFPLNYSKEECKNAGSLASITDLLNDDKAKNYAAPKLATGEASVEQFLAQHLEFPPKARDEALQGTVEVMFTVTKQGKVDNIYVVSGVNILLDKEAIRVIRHLKFSTLPVINGQPETICVKVPVLFKITD